MVGVLGEMVRGLLVVGGGERGMGELVAGEGDGEDLESGLGSMGWETFGRQRTGDLKGLVRGFVLGLEILRRLARGEDIL